jgi:hypothetical protein
MRATLIRPEDPFAWRKGGHKFLQSDNHGVPEVPGAAELEVRVHKFPVTTYWYVLGNFSHSQYQFLS